MKAILGIICFITTASNQAFAWGDLGHEVVAEIAQQLLKDNNKVNGAIENLVGIESWSISATWPDKMRSDPRFKKFSSYHYTTEYDDGHTSDRDALTVLNKFPSILSDSVSSRAQKLLALRFVVHVAGDLHQPLHVGNEYDRGGNSCTVTWQPNPLKPGYTTNLHKVWDTELVNAILYKYKATHSTDSYFDYVDLAKVLMDEYPSITSKKPRINTRKWTEESAEIRKESVYPDPQTPNDQRSYCKKDLENVNIPIIDQAYINKAMPIVEKQLVKAGVRLAAILQKTYKGTQPSPLDVEAIIDSMMLTND